MQKLQAIAIRPLIRATCSASCSTNCSWSWHHLIRLDYHKNVRSEGTLSNNFIPFRASVWVHALWLPGKHVCPLSYLMERARRVVQLPVDCVCNYPRWSFASVCRVYATFGLPHPGADISRLR